MSDPSAGGTRDTGQVDVRGPVAVVLSRFPTVTETFILREIREMERQGQPVRLVPLLRDTPPVVHREAGAWTERALFTPFLSLRIVAANLRTFMAAPLTYLSVLITLIRGMVRSPGFLIRSLILFPKFVYLAERLEEEGIRHVHAHFATHPATGAWVIASLSDLTYSITVHAHDIFVDETFLREKLESARFVRVISEFNRNYLLSRFSGLDPEKVRVVHVGVRVSRYGSERAGAEANDEGRIDSGTTGSTTARQVPGGDPPLIVTVASLQPYKGIPVLLNACKALRDAGLDFRCHVVGDGPLRGELESLTTALGLDDRIRFLGAIPEDEVPEVLARASIFVLPSVIQEDGQMEGIPVALMEAMAAGLPVVTSDLSGIPELVDDGFSGLLVPPGHTDGVAAAVRSLLEHPARARELGRRARDKVREEFSLEGCVGRHLELLGEHVGSGSRELRDRLQRSDALRRRTSSVGVRRVHGGRDSWVAELLLGSEASGRLQPRVPGGSSRWPREVVLKMHRSRPGASRSAPDRARTEFGALRDLATSSATVPPGDGNSGRALRHRELLEAPRPLHLDEPAATLLMTRCDGESLLDLLRPARWSRDSDRTEALAGALQRTGEWLAAFQDRTRMSDSGAQSLDGVAVEALEAVHRLRGDLLDPGKARSINERILDLRSRADAGTTRVVQHGDFWPGNVRIPSRGRVAVLDFEATAAGHPLEDPAYFLVQLSLYLAYPGLKRRRNALERAFLEGYGDPAAETSAAFQLCRRSTAARLLGRERSRARPLMEPTEWIRRRALLGILDGRGP